MGMNEVPFEPDVPCQSCGKMGSWDIMGDSLCVECASEGKSPKVIEARARKAFVPKGHPERDFQSQVIDLLRLHGYKVAHFGMGKMLIKGQMQWATPAGADGAGFADIVAIREDGKGVSWELKAGKNKATPEQLHWLRLFKLAGFHTGVYKPEDFEELKNLLEGM